MGTFDCITTEGRARRGRLHTVHGDIETPVFMNVGTSAAIKAAFRPTICGKSAARWSFPTPTTCTSGLARI